MSRRLATQCRCRCRCKCCTHPFASRIQYISRTLARALYYILSRLLIRVQKEKVGGVRADYNINHQTLSFLHLYHMLQLV